MFGIAVHNKDYYNLIFLGGHIVYAPIIIFNIADDTIPDDWVISVGDSNFYMMPKLMHHDYFLDRHRAITKRMQELNLKYLWLNIKSYMKVDLILRLLIVRKTSAFTVLF